MGVHDTRVFTGKGSKKDLVLELEEDEDLFESIKVGMMANKVKKVSVKDVSGKIKFGGVNYILGSQYKSKDLEDETVMGASGHYELKGANADNLFGALHVVINIGGKKTVVTLTQGIAKAGLKIRLGFIDVIE